MQSAAPEVASRRSLRNGAYSSEWYQPSKAIRDGNWKLVKHGSQDWELYDLHNDPTETQNLASKHTEQVTTMTKQWQDWWRQKSHRQ